MPTQKLLAKIHIAKKELGLEDETYREALNSMFKVQSSKDLNDRQAVILINHFKSLGWVQTSKQYAVGSKQQKKYADSPRDPYDASGAIKRKIEAMWHDLYRGNEEKRHLRQWLWNHFRVSDVQFLDKRKAYDAVEALKSMSRHRESKVPSPKSQVGTEKI